MRICIKSLDSVLSNRNMVLIHTSELIYPSISKIFQHNIRNAVRHPSCLLSRRLGSSIILIWCHLASGTQGNYCVWLARSKGREWILKERVVAGPPKEPVWTLRTFGLLTSGYGWQKADFEWAKINPGVGKWLKWCAHFYYVPMLTWLNRHRIGNMEEVKNPVCHWLVSRI